MTRRAPVVIVVLALLLSVGVAHAASTPWSGYRIDKAPTADGGFMGARKTDGRITYRIDATARRAAGGYRKVRRVTGDRSVSRAAWILAKYGDVRVADQAAAVDVATYALLSDVPVNSPRASKRLRSTGRAKVIRSLALEMLARSAKHAGPYHLTVTSKPGVVGGKVRVRVALTSYAGKPVAGLPVLLTLPDTAVRLETSAEGRVVTAFPAEEVGLRRLRVTVELVPEWRLSVRKPKHRGASRIALAGRKTKLVARTDIAVRAEPVVTIAAPTSGAATGKPFAATFALSGSEGLAERAVSASLHGPFPAGVIPTCSGTPAAQATGKVTGDGTYSTSGAKVPTAGYYVWRVTVAASELNAPASACGGVVRVRTQPVAKLDAEAQRLHFTVSKLPAGYDDGAVLRVFGPYPSKADATCKAGKKVGEVTRRVRANGDYTSPKVVLSKPGVYAWRLSLPASDLSFHLATACGAKGSFVTASS